MTPVPSSRIRVAFPAPHAERLEFVIELDRARHTERQIAECLETGWLYEHCTSWVMTGLLRPGDIAVDVGAHVGYYSLLMRSLVGDAGSVYAAEPMPQSFAALARNVGLNQHGNVYCAELAIGERNGEARFVPDAINEGESHLAAASPAVGAGSIMVCTATLDSWLAGLTRAPRLLKLDAEGCEAAILRGGNRLFRERPPESVVCEINPPALLRFGADQASLRRGFAEFGYACYLINVTPGGPYDLCQGAILRPYAVDETIAANVVHNLLFCRPGVAPVGLGV